MKKKLNWLLFIYGPILILATPVFDPTALLQNILIPSDVAIGTVIYRLRASNPNFDYPLIFTLRHQHDQTTTVVNIESLNCTRLNSICQANVILKKRLEANRFYDFIVDVKSTRGESASINCSFKSTDAITPISSIFPGAPTLLMVSESAKRNSELGTLIARGNFNRTKGVLLELWGATKFGLHQKLINERDAQGTLVLVEQLDYEVQTVHHVTVLANDPYTEMATDTRNIAPWPLLISVLDEQDTPPVFTLAPPTTTLSPTLQIGDVILLIHAEDGDRGSPRTIRYGLIHENSTFAPYFNISEETGELTLLRPLEQLLAVSQPNQPILLTVLAEEIRINPEEAPAQSSTAQIALIPPDNQNANNSPTFGANEYNAILDENSPSGTILEIHQAELITTPGNVVVLEMLSDNNNTFEVTPKAINMPSAFQIRVNNPKMLDYELWHAVTCHIGAKQVGSRNYSAIAKLTVLLNDVNDNPPVFLQDVYEASVPENADTGLSVLKIEATDIDREPGNRIKYMGLSGAGSEFFDLDPTTGLITVRDGLGLDAEKTPVVTFQAEAADENGLGQTSTTTIMVNLIDVNDEKPKFEKNLYEFILNSDRNRFTSKAIVKATDDDTTSPNNQVHYELITPVNNLIINEKTGELSIRNVWNENGVVSAIVRAYDGGIPRLSGTCDVKIYPPEGQSRRTAFIVPGRNPNLENIKKTIVALTGGRVEIEDVRPAEGYEPGGVDYTGAGTDPAGSSVVIALITYPKDSQVDIKQIQRILRQDSHELVTSNNINTTERKEIVTTTSSPLLWILLWLILLLLLIALILICCCICQGCPLYVPPKRRKVQMTDEDDHRKIVKTPQKQDNKSVQVAEWFGRKEAWSPERVHIENEMESLHRHEMDRGSDHRFQKQQQQMMDQPRDQYYTREGNADILRLITRGSETLRPNTLQDTGKDILMRRFIEQQQQQQMPPDPYRSYVTLPNSLSRLQLDHETLLETSLLQQNLLLRHILLERERDLKLETQSLPAGTQTDAATETNFGHGKSRRKVRSDNDASEDSEDDEVEAKRRNYRKRRLRKIKTPIQEESDDVERSNSKSSSGNKDKIEIKQTRTSELRQNRARGAAIQTEVLREISASLDSKGGTKNRRRSGDSLASSTKKKYFSQDSLEEISPRSEQTEKTQRYHSESDLNNLAERKSAPKTESLSRKGSIKSQGKQAGGKPTARYMEWYNKNPKNLQATKTATKTTTKTKAAANGKIKKNNDDPNPPNVKKIDMEIIEQELKSKETTTTTSEQQKSPSKSGAGPQHPLLQHSEHRFETNYHVRKVEEDTDSGIAVNNRLPKAQKKSVFTIAYDDMHTNQLRPDSHNSNL